MKNLKYIFALLVILSLALSACGENQTPKIVEIDPSTTNAKICVNYNGATITNLDNGKVEKTSQVWIYDGHDFSVKINDSIYSNFINSTAPNIVNLMQVIPDPDNDRVVVVAVNDDNSTSFIGYYHKDTPSDCFTVGPDLDKQR